jgi:hypothetical protein
MVIMPVSVLVVLVSTNTTLSPRYWLEGHGCDHVLPAFVSPRRLRQN